MIIPQPIKPVLFGWGSCSDYKNTNIPHRLKQPKSIESPEKVFASEGCNVVLGNKVAYSWSNNKYSRSSLGRKRGSPSNESTPRKVAMNVPIQNISQSHNHTLLLTSKGEVFGFGENTDNKLALSKKNVQLPTRINVEDCIDVACGASSSVFLLKDGSVKVAGLGANRNTRSKNLYSISFPVPISSVSCGSSHTVALSKNGKCYSFGCPDNGRLGLGVDLEEKMISSPRLVDLEAQMKEASCGSVHTLLLSVDGNVYAFGWNQFGQCGVDPVIMGDVHIPTLIKGTEEISLINAGFAHSAIVTKVDAQLFTFGNNESGQLGLRNETNQSKPTKVHFHRDSKYSTYSVIDVDCGNLHTLALVVPVDFQEYQENKSLIRRMKCGILVLEKFARLVLMKRRMRLFRETLKSRKEAKKAKPRISSPLLERDKSEHSEESSLDSSNHSSNDEALQVTSTLDELVAFESEDEISKLMTKRILRLEAYKQKKKLILLTEVQREREQIQMFQEDKLSQKKSHQDRIERLRKRMQTRIVDETRIEKQSKLSTVNMNQKVQKPLQTMKKKKKTKIKPTRPMKVLSTKEKNISLGRRKEPSKPKMPSKKRNDILLERRKARLLQQALKEQQEQERIAKEERQRQLDEKAAKKRQENIELERKESLLRRKKMLSNFTKKKRLHNTINTRVTEATNLNKNKKTFERSFKSVSDWNHRL